MYPSAPANRHPAAVSTSPKTTYKTMQNHNVNEIGCVKSRRRSSGRVAADRHLADLSQLPRRSYWANFSARVPIPWPATSGADADEHQERVCTKSVAALCVWQKTQDSRVHGEAICIYSFNSIIFVLACLSLLHHRRRNLILTRFHEPIHIRWLSPLRSERKLTKTIVLIKLDRIRKRISSQISPVSSRERSLSLHPPSDN